MIAACFRGFARWKVYRSFWHFIKDGGESLCTHEQEGQVKDDMWAAWKINFFHIFFSHFPLCVDRT